MITSLSLKNFKSWRDTGEMRLGSITGLFGCNSSGKSSILQFLLMLKQTVESSDRGLVLDFGGSDEKSYVNLGTLWDVMHSHDPKAELAWKLEWNSTTLHYENDRNNLEITHSAKIIMGKENSPEANLVKYSLLDDDFEYKKNNNSTYSLNIKVDNLKQKVGRSKFVSAPFKFYGFPMEVQNNFKEASLATSYFILESDFEKLFSKIFYLGPLREDPHREYTWGGNQPVDVGRKGERVIDALLASRSRNIQVSINKRKKINIEEYTAYWLKELKLIEEFSIEPVAKGSSLYQVWIKRTKKSPKVLITDVGFGVSQILPLIMLCYYVPDGSTVLIEQPEIHLHPSVQSGIADMFIDAVKKKNIQIIFESHSEHLLKRFQRRIAEDKDNKLVNDITLYFTESQNGESHLERLNMDSFGNISNWPRDFFGDQFGEMAAMTEAGIKRQEAK